MVPLSLLDLAPIVEGGDVASALKNSIDLAQHAERWGYDRVWVAEHHNIPSVASAATSVLMAHIAAATSTIRVGAGGIMLPNHAPLVIAEQFGTLEALHPGRIDLGLGRAPGTDPLTSRALRRDLTSQVEHFPQDVLELMAFLEPAQPGQRVQAIPGAGTRVPIWILGSSHFGAQLAARFGLPYAFASHFAPALMEEAVALYRSQFEPSERLKEPYVMLGLNVFAADSDEEARLLLTSMQQSFVALRTGRLAPLPPPREGYEETLGPRERAILDSVLSCTIAGDRETVRRGLKDFVARTGADELIVTAQIHDHAARLRSFEITAEVHAELSAARA